MSSRIAGIDFFVRDPLTVSHAVHLHSRHGWSLVEPLGMSYAVEDSAGDLDWQSTSPGNSHSITAMLDSQERRAERVGVCVYQAEAATGGQLLFDPTRTTLTFVPTINRRLHAMGDDFTDISWYVRTLLPGFLDGGLTGYEAEDIGF
jgi:hypothetical protein